jgi:hypothetical protein
MNHATETPPVILDAPTSPSEWTRYADKAPEPRQAVTVQLHGETYRNGTVRVSGRVEYFPPITRADGEGVGARWGHYNERLNQWQWERIHPEDKWRPAP